VITVRVAKDWVVVESSIEHPGCIGDVSCIFPAALNLEPLDRQTPGERERRRPRCIGTRRTLRRSRSLNMLLQILFYRAAVWPADIP
jgi:hypothetical protein